MCYQMAHLMANLDSERTLVVTFDQKPTNKQTKLTHSMKSKLSKTKSNDMHGKAPQQSNR